MTTQVSIRALRAALHFCDAKDVRFICKTVMIGGGALVATNGCSLFAHRIEDAEFATMIPMEAVQTLLATISKKADGAVTIEQDALVLGSCRVAYEQAPCRMPQWQCKVPRAISGEAAVYSPAYMSAVMKARDDLTGKKSPLPVQFGTNGPDLAGVAVLPMDSMAIVMPYRNEAPTVPEWVHANA